MYLGLKFIASPLASDPVDPSPPSEYDTRYATSEHSCEKVCRRKHASSKTNFVLWCAKNPSHPKQDHQPKFPAKVRVWFVAPWTANNPAFGSWRFFSHMAQPAATMGGKAR